MREFSSDYKINFVDTNDVLVGFDNSSSCCENFGWYYEETLPTAAALDQKVNDPNSYKNLHTTDRTLPADLDKYCFDPNFFEQIIPKKEWDVTNAVIFRLTWESKNLYLCLFNSHNGYYSHGFQMDVKGQKVRDGSL